MVKLSAEVCAGQDTVVKQRAGVALQEKGAGAPAGKDALKSGEAPKGRGFFTSAWVGSPAGHDNKDSPEKKKGVVTDPDMAPPKPESGKHDTPSSQKTNELVCFWLSLRLAELHANCTLRWPGGQIA